MKFYVGLKNIFLIYIKKKSFVTLNLKCIPILKHIFWPNQQFFVQKFLKCLYIYFSKASRKKIKHFVEKSFCVFGGALWRPLNTLKLFSAKCFYFYLIFLIFIIFYVYEKYICHNFKIFVTKICWYYLAMCFLTIIHFKLSVTKDLFLM